MPQPKRRRRARKTAKRNESRARRGGRSLPPECGTDSPTYESRMKAAGFVGDDEPPADIDAMRNALARRIAIFVNDWRGCRERSCRRMRGCMAPRNRCSNARPVEQTPEQAARDRALILRTLREVADRREAEEG